MRQAQRQVNRGLKARPVSLPAPVGGWNARDSLGQMAATDAVILQNWYPATTECVVRSGYSNHATGLPDDVETLMAYSGATTSKLFAVSNKAIYDVTSAGAVGAAAVSGLGNSRFQYVNFATAGGNFLLAVNGSDKMRYYTGSAWTYDGGGTYTVTGVDTSKCSGIMVHKSKIWLVEDGTLKVWYLPTESIAGAAQAINMSAVAQLGGYIVSAATWTIDAGTGVDDLFVAVTSNGEVIVYQGTDPSSASTWALKGVWRVGSPVGKRCFFKFAGDLLLISQDGILPLSSALQSSRVNPKVALTDKIQAAVSQAVTDYGDNFGWQLVYYAKANQLWLNVPATQSQQYAMNTISKSWCNYTGWNANCWELFGDEPYFGGNTVVCKAWDTHKDNGSAITAIGLQAFNTFGAPGQIKLFTMTRPVFRASGSPPVSAAINVDFDTRNNTAPLSFTGSSFGTWGSSTWGGAVWGGSVSIYQDWQNADGYGYYGAPQVQAAAFGLDVRWVSTDIVMQKGQIL